MALIDEATGIMSLPAISGDVTGFIVSPAGAHVGYEIESSVCLNYGGTVNYSKNIRNQVDNLSSFGIYNDNFIEPTG
jgi:hypothetical protein